VNQLVIRTMLIRDLLTSIRFLRRHKTFAIINISGLTIGIFSCLLIILYIHSELNFDKFHKNGKNIYRVVMHQPGNQVVGSSSDWWVVSPAILKPTWENELPEVDLVTRTTVKRWNFELDDQCLNEEVLVVDQEFLEIFSFPLIAGDKGSALDAPRSVILSHKTAQRYFGEEMPLGRQLVMNDGNRLTVTGILEDIPGNSHLQFNMLTSFATLESVLNRSLLDENWLNNSYHTYLTLHENSDLTLLDAKLRKYDLEGFNGNTWSFHLQPLYDIHFNQQTWGTGDRGTLFIFLTAGLFILFIACFNYLNLYIAHYRTRIRDVSIRKILGAQRPVLIRQFFCESLAIVLLSYMVALLVVWLALPFFNATMEQKLDFHSVWNWQVLMVSIGLIALMAFVSGVYPALYLSRYKVSETIRGAIINLSRGGRQFRQAVVIVQFSISIALIIGSATIIKQLSYARDKDLGYQKENIIYLDLINLFYAEDFNLMNKMDLFKQELLNNPDIQAVALSTGIPSMVGWSNIPVWEGKNEEDNPFFYRMIVDYDFMNLYGIQMESGRYFLPEMKSDNGRAYIINRAAADRMGLESPVGAGFGFDKNLGTVVGLTKDFHFESLHNSITPLGIGVAEEYYWQFVSLKVNSAGMSKTMNYIEDVWKKYVPGIPMQYSLLDDHLDSLYREDRQLSKSMNYLSLMALFISCLGIFGLMSLSLKERTKEVSIRKVMGASGTALLNFLLRDSVKIILISTVFGGVFGWYLSREWLNNFAFRCRFGLDVIVPSALLALFMYMLMIGFKLFRTITTNPSSSLRLN
jgi:putative ABC transport system permease protein